MHKNLGALKGEKGQLFPAKFILLPRTQFRAVQLGRPRQELPHLAQKIGGRTVSILHTFTLTFSTNSTSMRSSPFLGISYSFRMSFTYHAAASLVASFKDTQCIKHGSFLTASVHGFVMELTWYANLIGCLGQHPG